MAHLVFGIVAAIVSHAAERKLYYDVYWGIQHNAVDQGYCCDRRRNNSADIRKDKRKTIIPSSFYLDRHRSCVVRIVLFQIKSRNIGLQNYNGRQLLSHEVRQELSLYIINKQPAQDQQNFYIEKTDKISENPWKIGKYSV